MSRKTDSQPSDERAQALMMAALDREITPEDRRELDELLKERPDLAAEWRQFQHLEEVTRMTRIAQPPNAAFAGYWQSVYNRLERGIAWILVSIGTLVLVGWGLWQAVQDLLADTTTPLFAKLAIFALLLGGAMLGLSIAREKLTLRKSDPFKDVEQ